MDGEPSETLVAPNPEVKSDAAKASDSVKNSPTAAAIAVEGGAPSKVVVEKV